MDLSHFDTSHVTRMLGMFCDCYKLASLDLSNLNTSKITDMAYMFEDCRQMTSLNLSMFTTSFVINMVRMFAGCSKLRYINLENAEIKVTKLISTDIFADTPRNLILCSKYNEWNSFLNENILYLNCNFDYDIINEIKCYTKNISIPFNLCQTCGNNYLQLYNSNDQYHSNEYINCTKQISCYFSCKTCEKEGNITYHNCLECNDNYNYILNISNTKNCYNNCLNYFYYNEKINISFCTENNECPKEYDKLIPDIRKCISNCSNDEYYKYEFNNRCYNICPSNSIERINTKILNGISYGKYFCKPKCNEETPFEMVKLQKCVKYCNPIYLEDGSCFLDYLDNIVNKDENKTEESKKEEEIKKKDLILNNFEKSFTSENYNTSGIENGKNDVYKYGEFTITFTTTDNQKNNKIINDNITTINLGKCEDVLRKEYNISNNTKIFMKKIDIAIEGMKIPKIEYDVYCKLNGTNLIKLNISVCKNFKIDLSIPVEINEDIEKLNSSSDYYNNLCYPATSDSGTDIILSDRKNEFIENNKTLCQDDCSFTKYDYNAKKAICSCDVKDSSKSVVDMGINKLKLYNNFINIKNIANLNLLVCYRLLFSIKGIIKNYGAYSLIPMIVIHLIFVILFYGKSLYINIQEIIKNITFGLKNWKLVIKETKKIQRLEKLNQEESKNKIKAENENFKINKIKKMKNKEKSKKKKTKKTKKSLRFINKPISQQNLENMKKSSQPEIKINSEPPKKNFSNNIKLSLETGAVNKNNSNIKKKLKKPFLCISKEKNKNKMTTINK